MGTQLPKRSLISRCNRTNVDIGINYKQPKGRRVTRGGGHTLVLWTRHGISTGGIGRVSTLVPTEGDDDRGRGRTLGFTTLSDVRLFSQLNR